LAAPFFLRLALEDESPQNQVEYDVRARKVFMINDLGVMEFDGGDRHDDRLVGSDSPYFLLARSRH
jgi:hypothetical protein